MYKTITTDFSAVRGLPVQYSSYLYVARQILYLEIQHLVRTTGVLWSLQLNFEPFHANLKAIHRLNGCLGACLIVEAYKTKALALVCCSIYEDFRAYDVAKGKEHLHQFCIPKLLRKMVNEEVTALGPTDRTPFKDGMVRQNCKNILLNTFSQKKWSCGRDTTTYLTVELGTRESKLRRERKLWKCLKTMQPRQRVTLDKLSLCSGRRACRCRRRTRSRV